MKEKIKVGAVSYLNTKPLIYGFENGMMKEEIELTMDYPANIATMLLTDQIDIGLVPVSVIPDLKEHHIIADYGIGCDGEVGSVGLFSDVPLTKIKKILLDFQSRTSVQLLKILIKDYWQINPVIEKASHNYRQQIQNTTAGLVIGDRAFEQRKISLHTFDLGFEWKKYTGLPFVFAAWVSNKILPSSFISVFNTATGSGLQYVDKIVIKNYTTLFDLKAYYSEYISYELDAVKKKVMYDFLDKVKAKQYAL